MPSGRYYLERLLDVVLEGGLNNALESQIYILELFAGYAAVLHDQRSKAKTVRNAARRAVGLGMSKVPSRNPVTVSLRREGYQKLKALCQDQDWTTSKVLDDVIEAFLVEAEVDG